tara:strand:- start:5105 stop:7270 length:2166 start_codon:yes stop_codon:yes gene_type:complete
MALTPKEEKRYQELLKQFGEEEEQEEIFAEESAQELEGEPEDILVEESPVQPSSDSLTKGLVQGVTAGASDELQAGVQTAYDMAVQIAAQRVSGKPLTLSGMSTVYDKNLQDERRSLEKARKDNPWWYMAGDVVGTIGSFAYGAGELNLAKSVAMGMASGYLRSERKTLEEAAEDAVIGGGLSVFGEGVGRGITKAGKYVRETAKEFSSGSLLNALGITGKLARRDFRNHLVKNGNRTTQEFADDLFNMKVDGEPLFKGGQNFVETLDKVVRKKEQLDFNLNTVLSQVDDRIGAKFRPKDIYRELKRDFVDPLTMEGGLQEPTHRQVGNNLKKYLDDLFIEVVPEETVEHIPRQVATGVLDDAGQPVMRTVTDTKTTTKNVAKFRDNVSLKELNILKNKIYKHTKNSSGTTPSGQQIVSDDNLLLIAEKEKLGGRLKNIIQDAVETELDDEVLYASYKGMKRQDADLFLAERFITQKIDTLDGGLIGKLKDSVRGSGYLVRGGARTAGVNEAASLGLLASFNQFINSGSAPANLAVGLKNIANFIGRKPEIGGRIASNILAASAHSVRAFSRAIATAESEILLSENPISRNTQAVYEQAHHILPLIKNKFPDMAKKLQAALDDNNTGAIGTLMATLAEEPQGRVFVQPGLGWDGKAFTEKDITQVKTWIESIPSLKKKMYLNKDFETTRNIPQEMLEGKDGKEPMRQIVYRKAQDKLKKDY